MEPNALPPMPAPVPVIEKKKHSGCAFWFLGGLAVFFFLTTLVLFLALGVALAGGSSMDGKRVRAGNHEYIEHTVTGAGTKKVLVIPIEGLIASLPQEGFLQKESDMVAYVHDMLTIARKDADVRAVILAIDSPGGGVTASDVLHHEIMTFRKETGIPVIALLGDIAASGGYYVAAAADRIVAHPTTITGSIGVIIPMFSVEELLHKIGVESRMIKSGDMKDIGSMFRAMSAEERAVLQKIVDESYDRFLTVVSDGFKLRGHAIERDALRAQCDGRVFSGQTAMQNGFVDEIGYFKDGVQTACTKAGIQAADARVITYRRRPGLLDAILLGSASKPNEVTVRIEGLSNLVRPELMYLWASGAPQLSPNPAP